MKTTTEGDKSRDLSRAPSYYYFLLRTSYFCGSTRSSFSLLFETQLLHLRLQTYVITQRVQRTPGTTHDSEDTRRGKHGTQQIRRQGCGIYTYTTQMMTSR